jgi:hypothetical protein
MVHNLLVGIFANVLHSQYFLFVFGGHFRLRDDAMIDDKLPSEEGILINQIVNNELIHVEQGLFGERDEVELLEELLPVGALNEELQLRAINDVEADFGLLLEGSEGVAQAVLLQELEDEPDDVGQLHLGCLGF